MNKIKFSHKFHSFTSNGKAMRGIHPVIRKTFFPQYTFVAATISERSHASVHPGDANNKVTRLRPGMKAGLLVDTEIKRTFKFAIKYAIPVSAFISVEAQKKYASNATLNWTEKEKTLFQKKLAHGTTMIWQALYRYNLKPFAAQVPVADVSLRLGSAVDFVCKDTLGRHVIIEVKTGYSSYYYKHTNKPMLHLNITDTPANQHQLQLLLTYELFRRTFPNVAMGGASIWRVDGVGMEIVPLKEVIRNQVATILKAIQ